MENPIKSSITVLEEEQFLVSDDFSEQDKSKLIAELETKYVGTVQLVETRVFTPILIKSGLKSVRME